MKPEIAHNLVQNFLIEFADALDIHKDDIKNWIVEYYDGIMPDHNKFYEVKSLINSYLVVHREGIFRVDHKKAENYFKKHSEREKEFIKKKGKI